MMMMMMKAELTPWFHSTAVVEGAANGTEEKESNMG